MRFKAVLSHIFENGSKKGEWYDKYEEYSNKGKA